MRFESSTQTITWFQKEYREGNITLRPPYQRKPVWAARQKCYLIESILLGMPVPEIFVHETIQVNGDSQHAVVDGQQRIRTVLQFVGLQTVGPDGQPETDEEEFVGFALDKLDNRKNPSPYHGMRFADLDNATKIKFFAYKFHVRSLYTDDEMDLRNMFTRLNRYLTALNPQELRHATYVGPFPKLAEELSENEFWLKSGLMTRALIRRLGDVEFVSQLLIGAIHGPEGGSAAIVDDYYRNYEDYDLDEGFPGQRRTRKLFDETVKAIQQLFPDMGEDETRWGNRADFYTLFVALAEVLREYDITTTGIKELREALTDFSLAVDKRLGDEHAKVLPHVIKYVNAVEKGVNDKARRADRHAVVVAIVEKVLDIAAERKEKISKLISKKR
jgi:hypothetical protein